jgi:hypothetical protein
MGSTKAEAFCYQAARVSLRLVEVFWLEVVLEPKQVDPWS